MDRAARRGRTNRVDVLASFRPFAMQRLLTARVPVAVSTICAPWTADSGDPLPRALQPVALLHVGHERGAMLGNGTVHAPVRIRGCTATSAAISVRARRRPMTRNLARVPSSEIFQRDARHRTGTDGGDVTGIHDRQRCAALEVENRRIA